MSYFKLIPISTLACLALSVGGQAQDAAQLYEQGLYHEETKRDLEAAINDYGAIVQQDDAHAELQMQARIRLATCHLKLGKVDLAKTILSDLVTSLPSPDELNADPAVKHRALDQVLQQIADVALPDLDQPQLLDAAFQGMTGVLGGTAEYWTREQLEQFQSTYDNKLTGIGANLKAEGDHLIVQGVIDGSPAQNANLTFGDEILAIDGKRFTDLGGNLAKAVSAIRGEAGEPVTLTVKLIDVDETRDIEIVRQTIDLDKDARHASVRPIQENWILDETHRLVGIRLKHFRPDVAQDIRSVIDEHLQQDGMRGLVLDLRHNGGGSLKEAVALADSFLSEGKIVIESYRNKDDKVHEAALQGTLPDFPLVVLVDRLTASAAEIVAAALQDHQRATIIGERTYGKGTVETIVQVPGGGALKLPISHFLRPTGEGLHQGPDARNWGVQPDIELAMPDRRKGTHPSEDPALEKALEHLRTQLDQE